MTLESPLTSMLGRITDHWGVGKLLWLVQQIGSWIPRDIHRWKKMVLLIGISLAVAGCPKGRTDFNQGRKAQDLHDYDAAFEYYQKALKTDPGNAEYKIKLDQARFGAGELHTKNGLKLREKGDLENAASEFRKAAFMDPSSVAAEQELRKTIEMIEDRKRAT